MELSVIAANVGLDISAANRAKYELEHNGLSAPLIPSRGSSALEDSKLPMLPARERCLFTGTQEYQSVPFEDLCKYFGKISQSPMAL